MPPIPDVGMRRRCDFLCEGRYPFARTPFSWVTTPVMKRDGVAVTFLPLNVAVRRNGAWTISAAETELLREVEVNSVREDRGG